MRPSRLLSLLLLFASPVLAQGDYGRTEFANSGAVEAQAPFLRGLLMLHSFEYEDAREAFQEARRIDPDFAMAAWGEALTHNHPIWQEQDADAARAALAELADTPEDRLAKAPTEREKAYLRTLDVLYGEGEKEDRDFAYADALGDLATTYPDDLDAAAFYALSILGTAHEGRDFMIYMDAAAVAEEVFAANPSHPGAAHYLIHAYDDPIHAPLGLRPARVYDEIAPAASHALHMPSHIYFALGMWDEGAAMNVRSFEAAKDRTDARGDLLNGHGWHALGWLLYAELQRGRYAEAARLVDLASDLAAQDERRSHYASRWRARYLTETEDWTSLAEDKLLTTDSGIGDGQAFYVDVRAALARGDRESAMQLSESLARTVDGDEEQDPIPLIVLHQVEALYALDGGDSESALDYLSEAVALEDELPLDFGPARPVKPAHELLGDVLLHLGQPETAIEHYEETLARYPRRARALLGLARAAAATGDEATAAAVYADLAEIWRDADTDLAALAEVREHAPMGTR